MKIVRIFVSGDGEDGLWAAQFAGQAENEFSRFLKHTSDVSWLRSFFIDNADDLCSGYFGKISKERAVSKTLDEAIEMKTMLYDYWKLGCLKQGECLQYIFRPLNNYEFLISLHQKTKARLRGSWLRIYAIRISENCFVITGGAIKLTSDMRRAHLQIELRKLEKVKAFLQKEGVVFPEDLKTFQDE